MGILKEGIFGNVSGKVGPVICSSCRGVNYVKSKPLVYRDAKSELQKKSRNKFTKIGNLATSLLTTVIHPIWNNRVENLPGYNLFIKENYKNVDPELSLAECEKLIISFGNLLLPDDISVQRNDVDSSRITINWTDNSGMFGVSADDILRIVVICGDTAYALKPAGTVRSDKTAEMVLPYDEDPKVRVFIFFENEIKNEYSDDVSFMI